MKVATAAQMKWIDQTAQETYGIPGITLMEEAARAVLNAIRSLALDRLEHRKIAVVCGKGNNGGDGLALARLLRDEGADARVVLLYPAAEYRGLAAENLISAQQKGVPFIQWAEWDPRELTGYDFIVDAILGTGASGAPTGVVAAAIDAINAAARPVVAVDIPSGIQVDTGQVLGAAVKAMVTVTFGLPKPGILIFPGAEYSGKVIIASIGFPEPLLTSPDLSIHWLDKPMIYNRLPRRRGDIHKGSTGHTVLIGGSPGMTGAIALASLGALRAGCGLATVTLREELPFPEKPLEIMTKPWREIAAKWENYNSCVIGPGMTQAADGREMLAKVLRQNIPSVVDADGLNLLAADIELQRALKATNVLTPHPGEMARLTGLSVAAVQADRIGVATRFARERGVTLVLKGARTIIATPDGAAYINPTGNPGMASAGMGDVLAGIIGGLLAQRLSSQDAAIAGVFIHGLAGDLAAKELGVQGIIASDLLGRIPIAIRDVVSDRLLSFLYEW